MNSQPKTTSDIAPQHRDRIDIVLYTDPLCCWSWAFEPHWQHFTQKYADQIRWTTCMGGMIADWKTFNDPFNCISKPVQMGALWMHVTETTGAILDDRIWVDDPPASSYPACLAVKCAGMQSAQAEQAYLLAARQAVMTCRKNIAKVEVLRQLAFDLSMRQPNVLNYDRFCAGLGGPACRQALQRDLEKSRYHKIGRFPTITMACHGSGLMITGYRPFEALEIAFRQLCPENVVF